MQVHRDISNLPIFKNAAITIGTFDGVHSGHLQIIRQLQKEANKNDGESVIITFDPHPRMILNRQKDIPPIQLLTTLPEKIELLNNYGINHLVIAPFTSEFSNQSAEEYISDFLVAKFKPKTIIIGYDHHFGKNRTGNYQLLEKYQQVFGYKVNEIPEHILHHITISSTKIRQALLEGDISTANECLGYDYFIEGKVVRGNQIGRTLGYPTANLEVNNKNKLIPADGIYAVKISLGSKITDSQWNFEPESNHDGMLSTGWRPTIGDNKKMIEVNIFDFDKDIYDYSLRVYIKQFMRKELKLNSLDELKKQISVDEINAKKILGYE